MITTGVPATGSLRNDAIDGAVMPALWVRCKTCGKHFDTKIAVVDEKAFHASRMAAMYHVCPAGHEDRYEKKDYRMRSTAGKPETPRSTSKARPH